MSESERENGGEGRRWDGLHAVGLEISNWKLNFTDKDSTVYSKLCKPTEDQMELSQSFLRNPIS
jgi:hypothetical protein